jgi:hypothetical protein
MTFQILAQYVSRNGQIGAGLKQIDWPKVEDPRKAFDIVDVHLRDTDVVILPRVMQVRKDLMRLGMAGGEEAMPFSEAVSPPDREGVIL